MSAIILIALKFILIVVGGIAAGIIGSLTGLGGATVLVPLLSLFYGIPIIFATGASLVSTIATSAGSASAYTREKITNVKIGIGLEIATTVGAIVGSLTAVFVYNHNLDWAIYIVFGLVLLTSLIPTIQRGKYEEPPKMLPDWTTKLFQLTGSYFDKKLNRKIDYQGIRWWLAEFIMFFAGLISGLLGIGSGALKVLGMDWAMNLPMKVTTTTSNFMIGITAATGSSIYWYEGYVQIFIAAATALGVLIGSFFGAKILMRITNKNVRWIFFGILSFLGVEMLLKGLTQEGVFSLGLIPEVFVSLSFSMAMIIALYVFTNRERRKDHEQAD